MHVRGFGRTFEGCAERLSYLADLGVNVIELMPVHPFDMTGNYWGYMPLVWGAVHRPFATGDDAAAGLASLVGAAHSHEIEVWLDVVFNHTGEGDRTMPTLSLRGLDDANAYLHLADGTYNDDSGCGNVSNPGDPYIQQLVLTALQRFADLGIDGFRFDLASLLNRDGGGLINLITEWAAEARRASDSGAVGPCRVPGGPMAGTVAAMERSLPRRGPRVRTRRARSGARSDATCPGKP